MTETSSKSFAKTGFLKLDQNQWNRVEKKETNPHQVSVHAALAELGSGVKTTVDTESTYDTCGELIYLEVVRPTIVELEFVNKKLPLNGNNDEKATKKKKGNNKKKGMTREDIIRANSLKRVTESLERTLTTLDKNKLNSSYALKNN